MHPHDQAIELFKALQPHRFPLLIRMDYREQYSYEIFEQELLLQLWFRADDENEVEKPFLHLSFYGVDFFNLRPSSFQPFPIKIESIRHWQNENVFFKVSSYESSYNDYYEELKCRRFEASLEETFE
ncbi:hypothetical protein [Dictyobacter formicarum]|uniref:Uncharacterized protein n=1 Tax=Dictyobacter formicarum TaxID=2778368 RepID=A0ABQ3VES5_9CHLR|nr:hypothetical protein [Dictyobacter formicarum]GHO84662.1 hypothetical protein KSZ_26680 [Dictyobacter formicarum]